MAQANRTQVNMALLKQVAEDYTRSFSALQENVKAQRERIKDFDKRQEDKKTQKFEVSFMASGLSVSFTDRV